jgi:cytochrome c
MSQDMSIKVAATVFIAIATVAVAGSDRILVGDPVAGKQVYNRCIGCHSPERDRTGPRHCGLLGRKAASVPGFDYSAAMRGSNIIWDVESLNEFLHSPTRFVPGTSMGIAGIKDSVDRDDLIAYLQIMSESAEICGVTGNNT